MSPIANFIGLLSAHCRDVRGAASFFYGFGAVQCGTTGN